MLTLLEVILILATLETVLIKIASNGEMPFDFEWKQISQLVKRKILYCIDSMNTKVKHVIKYIILYNPFRPNINQQKNIRIRVIFFCREWKCSQKPPSRFNAFVNSFLSQKNIIRIQINIFMPFWNVFLSFQVLAMKLDDFGSYSNCLGWRKQAESDLPKEEPAKG